MLLCTGIFQSYSVVLFHQVPLTIISISAWNLFPYCVLMIMHFVKVKRSMLRHGCLYSSSLETLLVTFKLFLSGSPFMSLVCLGILWHRWKKKREIMMQRWKRWKLKWNKFLKWRLRRKSKNWGTQKLMWVTFWPFFHVCSMVILIH